MSQNLGDGKGTTPSEQILVVPAEKVNIKFKNGWYSGKDNSEILDELLSHSFFTERGPAEKNPELKQFIPYCLLFANDKLFVYERNKKGNEKRLHNLYSCGIGGHVDFIDGQEKKEAYWNGLLREMKEEVGLKKTDYWGQELGFIYDDSNEVGQVHLGVVHKLQLFNSSRELTPENKMSNWCFEKVETVKRNIESFEGWSQILIKNNVI